MRLKRLQQSLPDRLKPWIPLLERAGLKSTDQLIHTPLSQISRMVQAQWTELDKEPISFDLDTCEELQQHALTSQGTFSPLKPNGFPSLDLKQPTSTSGFGLETLDELLKDVWVVDQRCNAIIEIAGTAESGRSVSTAKKHKAHT